MASLTCECSGGRTGYTNLGDAETQWWVHAACGKPSEPWLRSKGDDVLNFFRGGPLDGAAYQTSTLLDGSQGEPGWTAQLAEYKWTPEVIVSQKTGASARVWLHKTLAPAEPEPTEYQKTPAAQPAQQATATGTSPAHHQEEKKMATLEDRRKELKLSRKQVAVQSGISEAKIARIEKEGERTTDEEKAAVSGALDALQAAQAEAAAAEPAGDPA